jgi:starch phosphorylase
MRDVSVFYLGDTDRLRRMSLIEEGAEKKVRMAHLAIVGSHMVNGVSELHTRLLKERNFRDFDEMFPGRFISITNGVAPRRWLLCANPDLAELITSRIGERWVKDLTELRKLERYVDDDAFRKAFRAVKRKNKQRLAKLSHLLTGVALDVDSIFDVQVKRIHEYKRQLLGILYVIYRWIALKKETENDFLARTFIFGGKASPSYHTAKTIIRLICHVAEMVNRDAATSAKLQVVFLPNYRVSLAEKIFPAADISEQISTAGFEASGTSCMKFALNGALTLATLDGANIEIMQEVGADNIFTFGLRADEVIALRPNYDAHDYYSSNSILKRAIDLIRDGFFSPEEPGLFRPLIDALLKNDYYMVLADFEAYCRCQGQLDALYRDPDAWTKKAILNLARIGRFSSDRAIGQYNREIWHAHTVTVSTND